MNQNHQEAYWFYNKSNQRCIIISWHFCRYHLHCVILAEYQLLFTIMRQWKLYQTDINFAIYTSQIRDDSTCRESLYDKMTYSITFHGICPPREFILIIHPLRRHNHEYNRQHEHTKDSACASAPVQAAHLCEYNHGHNHDVTTTVQPRLKWIPHPK